MVGERLIQVIKPIYHRYHEMRADHISGLSDIGDEIDREEEAPDHIVVLVIDALRPDHVPELPLEFTTGIAPGTWTFPSVTSLHTGLYPASHGCNLSVSADEKMRIPTRSKKRTFVEYLQAADYETFAGCGFPMPFFSLRGWYDKHRIFQHARAETVTEVYHRWRQNRDTSFAYLHFADLHEPLDPPERFISEKNVDLSIPNVRTWDHVSSYDGSDQCRRYRKHRLRLYGAALDYVQEVLTEFLKLYGDSTFIILTGDHGESHWEQYELAQRFTDSRNARATGHGGTPFDMTARVPIGVSSPAGSVGAPGPGWPSLIDIPRTILHSVGIEDLERGLAWQDPIPTDRAVRCEASRYGAERKAVYRGSEKLIRSKADDVTLLGTVDQTENTESLREVRSTDTNLVEALPDQWQTTGESRRVGRITAQQLKALGYR